MEVNWIDWNEWNGTIVMKLIILLLAFGQSFSVDSDPSVTSGEVSEKLEDGTDNIHAKEDPNQTLNRWDKTERSFLAALQAYVDGRIRSTKGLEDVSTKPQKFRSGDENFDAINQPSSRTGLGQRFVCEWNCELWGVAFVSKCKHKTTEYQGFEKLGTSEGVCISSNLGNERSAACTLVTERCGACKDKCSESQGKRGIANLERNITSSKSNIAALTNKKDFFVTLKNRTNYQISCLWSCETTNEWDCLHVSLLLHDKKPIKGVRGHCKSGSCTKAVPKCGPCKDRCINVSERNEQEAGNLPEQIGIAKESGGENEESSSESSSDKLRGSGQIFDNISKNSAKTPAVDTNGTATESGGENEESSSESSSDESSGSGQIFDNITKGLALSVDTNEDISSNSLQEPSSKIGLESKNVIDRHEAKISSSGNLSSQAEPEDYNVENSGFESSSKSPKVSFPNAQPEAMPYDLASKRSKESSSNVGTEAHRDLDNAAPKITKTKAVDIYDDDISFKSSQESSSKAETETLRDLFDNVTIKFTKTKAVDMYDDSLSKSLQESSSTGETEADQELHDQTKRLEVDDETYDNESYDSYYDSSGQTPTPKKVLALIVRDTESQYNYPEDTSRNISQHQSFRTLQRPNTLPKFGGETHCKWICSSYDAKTGKLLSCEHITTDSKTKKQTKGKCIGKKCTAVTKCGPCTDSCEKYKPPGFE